MKLTAFLLVAPALLAAALPTGDVLSEIEKREASPIAEAEPLYYSRSILCDFKFKVQRKRKQPFQLHLLTTTSSQSSELDTSPPPRSVRLSQRPKLKLSHSIIVCDYEPVMPNAC
jgi:hypothetical protein